MVSWERIVKIAHDTVAMGTEDIVMVDTTAAKPNRATAQPRQAAPPRVSQPVMTNPSTGISTSLPTAPTTNNNNSSHVASATSAENGNCWICEDMGLAGPHRHQPDQCFCNPKSKHFKKEVYSRRVARMKRENRAFSERLKGLGEPPAGSLYSTVLD